MKILNDLPAQTAKAMTEIVAQIKDREPDFRYVVRGSRAEWSVECDAWVINETTFVTRTLEDDESDPLTAVEIFIPLPGGEAAIVMSADDQDDFEEFSEVNKDYADAIYEAYLHWLTERAMLRGDDV